MYLDSVDSLLDTIQQPRLPQTRWLASNNCFKAVENHVLYNQSLISANNKCATCLYHENYLLQCKVVKRKVCVCNVLTLSGANHSPKHTWIRARTRTISNACVLVARTTRSRVYSQSGKICNVLMLSGGLAKSQPENTWIRAMSRTISNACALVARTTTTLVVASVY